MFLIVLLGCDTGAFTITATKLDAKADTCTFTVQFPEDYHDVERGEQTFTVTPLGSPRDTVLARQVDDLTTGIGIDLRRRCAGYLATAQDLMGGT